MSVAEARIQDLARQHLDIGGDRALDAGLLSNEISSLDVLALVKEVGKDLGVELPAEEVANWKNLRGFTALLDSSTGCVLRARGRP